MTNLLQVWSNVDPRELQINRRFKKSQFIHPRARAAQRQLADDIRAAIAPDYQPCRDDCAVHLILHYPDRRSDIDGPIKRVLDALEMAVKEAGYAWHDGRIDHLRVSRRLTDIRTKAEPGIYIQMF